MGGYDTRSFSRCVVPTYVSGRTATYAKPAGSGHAIRELQCRLKDLSFAELHVASNICGGIIPTLHLLLPFTAPKMAPVGVYRCYRCT